MRDPATALVAALKKAPGFMVDAQITLPGGQPVSVRVVRNVSVENVAIGRGNVNAFVRLVQVHSSDVPADVPAGTMHLDGVDYRVQVAAEMDRDGWWTLGLTVPRLGS